MRQVDGSMQSETSPRALAQGEANHMTLTPPLAFAPTTKSEVGDAIKDHESLIEYGTILRRDISQNHYYLNCSWKNSKKGID